MIREVIDPAPERNYLLAMTKIISAADASEGFSSMLRQVQQGEDFLVLSQGRAVARVLPCQDSAAAGLPDGADMATVVARLRERPNRDLPGWTRSDLYE